MARTQTPPDAGEDVKQQELSFIGGGNAKMAQLLWKTVWQLLQRELPHQGHASLCGQLTSNDRKMHGCKGPSPTRTQKGYPSPELPG